MPNIDYPTQITESLEELEELEKRHRYSHLFQRVRMLRLLKSRKANHLEEAGQALGYSRRQCQRWWNAYSGGGLKELLISRVDERGPQQRITEQAWAELCESMKAGEIASYSQVREFLSCRGIEYASADSVGDLMRRRRAKLKTGRPRHQQADAKEQQRFKKSSLPTSEGLRRPANAFKEPSNRESR